MGNWLRNLFGTADPRVGKLELEMADLRMSFTELQDKVYRWMQRTHQRERREEQASTPAGARDTSSFPDLPLGVQLRRRKATINGVQV